MEIMSFQEMRQKVDVLWPRNPDIVKTRREEALIDSLLGVIQKCMEGVKIEMEGRDVVPTLVTRLLRENEEYRKENQNLQAKSMSLQVTLGKGF